MTPIETLRAMDPTGERRLLQRTITKFADYGEKLLSQLADLVANHEADEVCRLTHSLKSSSAMLGAKAVTSLCADMERDTRHGDLPADIRQRLADLEAAYARASRDLLALID